jgi:arylsulfatase
VIRARALALAAGAALLACGGGPALPPPRHLVLVSVDTLRADHLGFLGYPRARTPHLDALAAESLVFERAYSHSSATLPAVASLLTGRLPGGHTALSNFERIPETVPTLAAPLAEAGFATAGFIGNYVLRRGQGFDPHFQVYTTGFLEKEEVRGFPENSAAVLTDLAVGWIGRREPGQRFFLWVHYQDPHGPYTPPDFDRGAAAEPGPDLPESPTNSGRNAIPKYQWLGHGHLPEYVARYDGEIAETDRQIGRLIEALRERRLLDESLLVFTADHGEAFGEAKLYAAHGEDLSDVLLRVPLVLRIPGRAPERRRDQVRHIDVAPTALELLGVPVPESLDGTSLLVPEGDRVVAAQMGSAAAGIGLRAVRTGEFKLVETRPPGRIVVRDLRNGGRILGDAEEPEVRARLLETLDRLAPFTPYAGPSKPLSDEECQNLKALGYLDDC